jgi:hypothetical protein
LQNNKNKLYAISEKKPKEYRIQTALQRALQKFVLKIIEQFLHTVCVGYIETPCCCCSLVEQEFLVRFLRAGSWQIQPALKVLRY